MKYLIDTHILLWHAVDNNRLTSEVKALLNNPNNEIYLSHASIWEITIKISIGKLQMSVPLDMLEAALYDQQFQLLDFQFSHYLTLKDLPFHHQDPFDRMIIAQGITEKMTIITADDKFKQYDVTILNV